MKKILFVIDSLRTGGIQTSLVNLLELLDCSELEISLLSFSTNDEFKKNIPNYVKILKSNKILSLICTPSNEVKKKGVSAFIFRKILALLCRIFSANFVYSILFKTISLDDQFFDVAVSYSNNGDNRSVYFGCNKFVLEKVRANKKISWLHVNYQALKMNTTRNNQEYRQYDKVICVSKDVESSFIKYLPDMYGKTEVIYNVLNIDDLYKKADFHYKNVWNDGYRIITVARLDSNKNIKESLMVARILKENHLNFKWVILGDGPEYNTLRKLQDQLELFEEVEFLGNVSNPYPFIKDADLYVSTSLTESFGLSIYESLILSTPAVVKYYPAANEVVKDGINGYIINGNEEEIAECIINLFNDKRRYNQLTNYRCDYKAEAIRTLKKIKDQF